MLLSALANLRLGRPRELRDAPVGEAELLGPPHDLGVGEGGARDLGLEGDDLADPLEEPPVDPRERMDLRGREARAIGVADREDTIGRRHAQEVAQLLEGDGPAEREPPAVLLERADGLLERLLEGPPDRHHLAHRLHLGRERPVGLGEFFERPPGELHHAVVDRRLERRGRLPRDIVADLVEGVADGELGRDLGDGKAGRLRGERRGARHTRVHLDHDEAPVVRVDRELDIRATRLDADLPHDGDRGVAHQLVFLVRERLCRRDGDRVSRVDAHRIEILDRADDDDVVRAVPHDLELELFPADHRFLDQHGADR